MMIEPELEALAARHHLHPNAAERLQAFLGLVRKAPHNLVSKQDRGRLLERHVADSLEGLETLLPQPLLDIGSGAGFPALVLACCQPQLPVTLIESNSRKAGFLRSTARKLQLEHITVMCERTESLGRRPEHREAHTQLCARAVAPLASLLELAAPLTSVGGLLLAWKGSRADEEIQAALPAAETLGWVTAGRKAYRLGDGHPRAILRLIKRQATPEGFPRKAGRAAKSPIRKKNP